MSKKIRKKSSRQWLDRHVSDPYVRRAQQEGFRARSVYKLLEIDEVERLLRPGMTVVELGAAPGAWSQLLSKRLFGKAGPKQANSKIIALDILEMDGVPNVELIQADFREDVALELLDQALDGRSVDLVLSDMSPNMSGVASADMARMADLMELAFDFALERLTNDGALMVKSFHGSGFSQQVERFKSGFVRVRERKPASSRPESAETYLIGKVLKHPRVGNGPATKAA